MGYRLYLATMDKVIVEQIRHLNLEEFLKTYGTEFVKGEVSLPSPYDLPTHNKVHEMGSYVDQEFTSAILGEDPQLFFTDEELNRSYEEYGLYLVDKSGLLALIDRYRERVAQSYKDMQVFTPDDRYRYYDGADLAFKQKRFFESRQDTWEGKFVDYLNTDESDPHSLSRFWDFEYLVFNLIHLLKTLDWENKQLVFYGY